MFYNAEGAPANGHGPVGPLGPQPALPVGANAGGPPMYTAPVVTEYVNRVGQNVVRNSDARVPFTIKVIDSSQINAFALPGGFFYVNSGLILAADDEAERRRLVKHATQSESVRALRAMVMLARSEPGVPVRPDQLDADPCTA